MNSASAFLDSARAGDWPTAIAIASNEPLQSSLATPGSSVFAWLVDLDAPPQLVVTLLKHCAQRESIDPNQFNLLEHCLRVSSTHANAFETFKSLLAFGQSPNVIVNGGATLLQEAMTLNKVREVEVLLRFGAAPNQMSIFGPESTSNIVEAKKIGNAAADTALAFWRHNDEERAAKRSQVE